MSGINPLIDTLLHQVLGKHADVPPPRDLNQPVRPVDPGAGPRALHSDSRLDGRGAGAPLSGLAPTPQRGEAPSQPLPLVDATRQASFQTHFSASARTIADVLLRFPAPPSVLSPQAPLMGAGETPNAAALAERLQSGVRDSGLFYESHLSKWYRGEMTRQQLEREPQTWRTLRFAPAAAGSAGQPPAPLVGAAGQGGGQPGQLLHTGQMVQTGTASPAGQAQPAVGVAGQQATTQQLPLPTAESSGLLGATKPAAKGSAAQAAGSYAATGALLPRSDAAAAQPEAVAPRAALAQSPVPGAEAAAGREATDPAALHARGGAADPVHESLQGLVRHQLEMLVAPVLRWEGDVWSGIFMALMVQIPAAAQRDGEGGQEGAADQDDENAAWHSELRLEVPRLGEIKVALWLRDTHLRLELRAADDTALASLQEGAPRLKERLQAAGFDEVLIDTRRVPEEGGDG
ncbi:flagellar hook-length control protein FliK [Halomonas sp. NO4]|uniref:flagellar hook-length control protein FliK n=1 Tax=Halomonas sp. NO4 TaxID=2484813 RepID=UPI0013D37CA1|nr:flagellar hook-length control protein FliK [Halomonas sp. NO4]